MKPEPMDAESADMLAALRRQIQPHLMMAALTTPPPTGTPQIRPPHLPGAPLNFGIPLNPFMMQVSYFLTNFFFFFFFTRYILTFVIEMIDESCVAARQS